MKKLYIFITIIVLANTSLIYSQEESSFGGEHEKKNIIYGDLGFGIYRLAGSLRLNYERQVYKKNAINLTGRVGIGYWFDWTAYGTEIPLTLQVLFFKSVSHLELGAGIRWYSDPIEKESGAPFIINFGYRYQKPGKFLFRANAEYNGFYLIPTISFGTSF